MPILGSYNSPDHSPRSSLRLPAQKRISTPASVRLTTITEGANSSAAAPPIPRRSSRRNSASHSEANSRRQSRRWSGTTAGTGKTAPPPYDWVPEPVPGADGSGSGDDVVDERLEKLRREGRDEKPARRGGWKRAVLIGIVVLVVVIALGVGLGVGLTRKKNNNGNSGSQNGSSPPAPPQKFPLGEYSLDTALRSVSTACTSNPATWRCFPYITYSPDGSTNETSVASFNWVIRNSSATYATNSTASTPDAGIPANLTVSTSNDPFGITFSNKSLTYISTASNTTSPRYTFSFTMARSVIPSPAITTDDSNAECFFNQTLFTANLYLSAEPVFPADSTSMGGYEPWPYAVGITQTAAGGSGVPDCYETVNGQMGNPVSGLIPQAASAECMCDYRNY